MKLLLGAILITAPLLAALPATAADRLEGRALDAVPHITIVGTARAEVAPDIATILLGVTTEQPTARAAAEANAPKARAVIDAAKADGVPAADIATQAITLTQTFDDIQDAQGRYAGRKPRGFTAENTVAIKVRDLAKVGALAESLIAKGANRFDGITFSVEHPEPILDRLTADAVKHARDRAQIAATAAGVRLGRVLRIERPDETSARPVVPGALALKATASAMPVEAGTTTLGAEIAVTWALGDD